MAFNDCIKNVTLILQTEKALHLGSRKWRSTHMGSVYSRDSLDGIRGHNHIQNTSGRWVMHVWGTLQMSRKPHLADQQWYTGRSVGVIWCKNDFLCEEEANLDAHATSSARDPSLCVEVLTHFTNQLLGLLHFYHVCSLFVTLLLVLSLLLPLLLRPEEYN